MGFRRQEISISAPGPYTPLSFLLWCLPGFVCWSDFWPIPGPNSLSLRHLPAAMSNSHLPAARFWFSHCSDHSWSIEVQPELLTNFTVLFNCNYSHSTNPVQDFSKIPICSFLPLPHCEWVAGWHRSTFLLFVTPLASLPHQFGSRSMILTAEFERGLEDKKGLISVPQIVPNEVIF